MSRGDFLGTWVVETETAQALGTAIPSPSSTSGRTVALDNDSLSAGVAMKCLDMYVMRHERAPSARAFR